MHCSAQSRSAWTEQEDELLRAAVARYGDRAWATVANDVPGRSSKSCSDRWRNFLSPDIEHPRKSPFTEWEVAVVVQAQHRYGNNWKAISMLLPGRTNRAVKNLFVGNLKWGARLAEIRNRYLECNTSLEELLEIKPDHAGGPVRPRPGCTLPAASGSPGGSSLRAASTSSAGSAWASDITDQPLSGSPGSTGTHRKRGDGSDLLGLGQGSPPISKRRRGTLSPAITSAHQLQHYSPSGGVHPGALGPGAGPAGSPTLGLSVAPVTHSAGTPTALVSSTGALLVPGSAASADTTHMVTDDSSPALTPGSALAAGLAGGCFGRAGAGLAAPDGQQCVRSASMPGVRADSSGGLPAGRVASWHPGQLPSSGGVDVTALAAGSTSPFANCSQLPGATSGGLSSLLDQPGADLVAAAACIKPEPSMGDAAGGGYGQQQQQWLQHGQLAGVLEGSDMAHLGAPTASAAAAAAAAAGAMGSGLGVPGSPVLAANLLGDMRSNDSAALQQILEQIFDEDELVSDAHLAKLIGSPDALAAAAAQQPGQPLVQPLPQQPQQRAHSFGGRHVAAGGGEHAQPHEQQQHCGASAGGPAGSLARSSTWPSWQEAASEPGAAALPASACVDGLGTAARRSASQHACGSSLAGQRAASAGGLAPMLAEPPLDVQAGCNQQAQQPLQHARLQAGSHHGRHWSAGGGLPPSAPHSAGGTPPPGAQQPHVMQLLCAQLQQENMLLMHRVHNLESRLTAEQQALSAGGAAQPTAAACSARTRVPSDATGMGCETSGSDGSPLSAATAGPCVAALLGAEPELGLPKLPPVLTRVGDSAAAAAAGMGTATSAWPGLLDAAPPAGQLEQAGGSAGGSDSLVLIKADPLQSGSPGSFTPGQLIHTAFVDDALMHDLE